MTVRELITECDMYEHSADNYRITKLINEISLMETAINAYEFNRATGGEYNQYVETVNILTEEEVAEAKKSLWDKIKEGLKHLFTKIKNVVTIVYRWLRGNVSSTIDMLSMKDAGNHESALIILDCIKSSVGKGDEYREKLFKMLDPIWNDRFMQISASSENLEKLRDRLDDTVLIRVICEWPDHMEKVAVMLTADLAYMMETQFGADIPSIINAITRTKSLFDDIKYDMDRHTSVLKKANVDKLIVLTEEFKSLGRDKSRFTFSSIDRIRKDLQHMTKAIGELNEVFDTAPILTEDDEIENAEMYMRAMTEFTSVFIGSIKSFPEVYASAYGMITQFVELIINTAKDIQGLESS